jgi:hypothetical protein
VDAHADGAHEAAVATPMPPKPKMPQTRPASMRFGVCWLKAPVARAWCSKTSRLVAASAIVSACSAMGAL